MNLKSIAHSPFACSAAAPRFQSIEGLALLTVDSPASGRGPGTRPALAARGAHETVPPREAVLTIIGKENK